MDLHLRGKRVLITGASKGIGAAAAEAFAEEGCDLRLAARSGDALKTLAERLRSTHQIDATAHVVEDWMYERVTDAYVADPDVRKFFERSNPWALRAIAERLLEAHERGLWRATAGALDTLRSALLEAEGWEEAR